VLDLKRTLFDVFFHMTIFTFQLKTTRIRCKVLKVEYTTCETEFVSHVDGTMEKGIYVISVRKKSSFSITTPYARSVGPFYISIDLPKRTPITFSQDGTYREGHRTSIKMEMVWCVV
jgi:hypothetical protein